MWKHQIIINVIIKLLIVFQCCKELSVDPVHPGLLGRPETFKKSKVTSTRGGDQQCVGIPLILIIGNS